MNIEILPGIYLHGMPVGEIPDRIGQLRGPRHRRAKHENRDYRHLFAQPGLDLDAHRVSLIVKPGLATTRAEPFRANDGEQDVAFVEDVVDVLAKIRAWRNAVDVAKNRVTPKCVASRSNIRPVITPELSRRYEIVIRGIT